MDFQEIVRRVKNTARKADAYFCTSEYESENEREFFIPDYLARCFYKENSVKTPWHRGTTNKESFYRIRKLEELNSAISQEEILTGRELLQGEFTFYNIWDDEFVYDEERINRMIGPEFIYAIDEWNGKPVFLIGKLKQHSKIKENDVYVVGEEIFSNFPIEEQAKYTVTNKILLRTYTTQLNVWRTLDALKLDSSEMLKGFVTRAVSYATRVNPKNFTDSVLNEAATRLVNLKLDSNLHHELGHSKVNFSLYLKYPNLQRFITSVSDALADSFSGEGLEGKLAFVNNRLGFRNQLALLSLDLARTDESWFVMQRELNYAYAKLIETDGRYIGVLEDARKVIWDRSSRVADEIREVIQPSCIKLLEEYEEARLQEIKERETREALKVKDTLKHLLKKALSRQLSL